MVPLTIFCFTEFLYEIEKLMYPKEIDDIEYKLKTFWLISNIAMIPAIKKYKFYRFIPGLICGFIGILCRFYMEYQKKKKDKTFQYIANGSYAIFKFAGLIEMISRKYYIISIFFILSVVGTSLYLTYMVMNPDWPIKPKPYEI